MSSFLRVSGPRLSVKWGILRSGAATSRGACRSERATDGQTKGQHYPIEAPGSKPQGKAAHSTVGACRVGACCASALCSALPPVIWCRRRFLAGWGQPGSGPVVTSCGWQLCRCSRGSPDWPGSAGWLVSPGCFNTDWLPGPPAQGGSPHWPGSSGSSGQLVSSGGSPGWVGLVWPRGPICCPSGL